MNSLFFNDEHDALRSRVRDFVQSEINPYVDDWEAKGIFPAHELFGKLGSHGLLGLTYPEEYGGGGLDFWNQAVFLEEIGRSSCGGVPMAIAVQTDMATPTLAAFGTPEQKEEFLRPAISGDAVFSIAVSEANAGSDVAGIRTRAVSDGDDYVINGSKMWVTNGTQADFLTLLARTDDRERGFKGMSLIVVPTDSPGFSVERKLDKLGQRSSDTAALNFDNVRVPKSNRLGQEGMGFILQMQQFQVERLAGSLMGAAGLDNLLRMTTEYCRERREFDQALLDNQWVHFQLAELIAEVDMLKNYNYHCVAKYVAGQDMTREASIAKLKVGRLSRQVIDTCMQFHGDKGYMEDYPLARAYRDTRLASIGGGADEMMLGIIAKIEGLLPGRKQTDR